MPHLVLEYTSNLTDDVDVKKVMLELNTAITATTDLLKIRFFKCRAIRHDVFAIGDGKVEQGFVHLDIRTVTGKGGDDSLKKAVSEAALAVLCRAFRRSLDDFACDVSVQISEASPAGYVRARSTSLDSVPA